MTLYLAIAAYAVAMLAANFLVFAFGPAIAVLNAFLLIGLDLTLRDLLHVKLRAWQLAALVAATGVLTYALNPAAGPIALAATVAFTLAALADWAVFAKMRGFSWPLRANSSNVAGAAVDSVVFPLLAWGSLTPAVFASMFAAKVLGGLGWTLVLKSRAKAKAARVPDEPLDWVL